MAVGRGPYQVCGYVFLGAFVKPLIISLIEKLRYFPIPVFQSLPYPIDQYFRSGIEEGESGSAEPGVFGTNAQITLPE